MDIKIPPHNIEAEKGVLGSVLIDSDSILKASEILGSQDFYEPRHRLIYESILELYHSQYAIDILTLTSHLKKKKQLVKVGGASYIGEIVEGVPSSAHIENYSRLVKESSVRRQMIRYSAGLAESAYDETSPTQEILNDAEKGIFKISQDNVDRDFVHVSDLLEVAFEKAAELKANEGQLRGISSGLSNLDNILGGFQNSDLVIIAARPSVGKSALCIDFARHAAVKLKKKVGIFSLEMSNLEVMNRLLSMQVGVGLWDLRMGKFGEEVFEKLGDAIGVLSESGIYIDDTPGVHINEIRTKCRRLKLEKGLDMLIIDYLQLIMGNKSENRVQEVSEISRFLKIIAKELDIPVIAAAQLSRATEQRNDRMPQLSDLRESGSIEQDADVVIFLRREETFNPDTEKKGITDVIVAKHRNGPTGMFELFFNGKLAKFVQLETRYDEV